ncbi:MAG TPA: phage holin family protein [Bryobacteraceae bacterium]|nr:phage holin family protein [Bryobacteraceae bacterium]
MTPSGDRSISEILDDMATNVQRIIRSEVRLAKTEVQEEAVKAGKGAAVLGSGAVVAAYSAGFLLLAALFALEIAVPSWLAALIVAVFSGTIGAALVTKGITRIKQVHFRPERTINTMKENLEWAKNQTR